MYWTLLTKSLIAAGVAEKEAEADLRFLVCVLLSLAGLRLQTVTFSQQVWAIEKLSQVQASKGLVRHLCSPPHIPYQTGTDSWTEMGKVQYRSMTLWQFWSHNGANQGLVFPTGYPTSVL
jgi:hypothetical protein